MPAIELDVYGDGCWPDLEGRPVIDLMGAGPPIRLALRHGGMASGRPSVAIRIDLPDGTVILTETALQLLAGAVAVMQDAAGWRVL